MALDQGSRAYAMALYAAGTAGIRCMEPTEIAELVDTWDSRTATLYRFRSPSAPCDIVAKVYDQPEQAVAHFHSMHSVASALDGLEFVDSTMLRPISVSEDLCAVFMPFAGDKRLSELLQNGLESRAHQNKALDSVSSCGASLARYHLARRESTANARKLARANLETRLIDVLGSSRPSLNKVSVRDCVAQSYGDFHPDHVIVTAGNKLVFIDPPIEVRYEYPYRDLAMFRYQLFLKLWDPRTGWRHPSNVRHHGVLGRALLDGYFTEMGWHLNRDDALLIDTCEAFFLSRMLKTSSWTRRVLSSVTLLPARHRTVTLKKNLRYEVGSGC